MLTHTQQTLRAFLLAATYLVPAPPYKPYKASASSSTVVHPDSGAYLTYAYQLDLT